MGTQFVIYFHSTRFWRFFLLVPASFFPFVPFVCSSIFRSLAFLLSLLFVCLFVHLLVFAYLGRFPLSFQNWLAFSKLHRPLFTEHGSVYFANGSPPPQENNGAYCKVMVIPSEVLSKSVHSSRARVYEVEWYNE